MGRQRISNRAVRAALERVAGPIGCELDRASFHPFPARMPRAIAAHLIDCLCPQGGVVLDPMAGSGTTLTAARASGRPSFGFDRDPLALLLARCATKTLRSTSLEALGQRVIERSRKLLRTGQVRLDQERQWLPAEDREFVRYWFPPKSQKQLFALAKAIQMEPARPENDVARVVLSSLIIAKSAGASHALDISRSRPHKRTDKEVVAPFDAWDRRFSVAVKRLPLTLPHFLIQCWS